jgi:hypothetical protein
MSLKKYGSLQGKQQLFHFQSSRQYFISVSWNIDFLNQLWTCYGSFTFKLNLLHMIIRYFLGINGNSLSIVFVVGKKLTPIELIGKLLFMALMAICHHLKILLSISPVNDSPLIFKNMPVLFTSTKKYSASKYCLTMLFMK